MDPTTQRLMMTATRLPPLPAPTFVGAMTRANSSNSGNLPLTKHADRELGDLVVAIMCRGGGTGTWTDPTDGSSWTEAAVYAGSPGLRVAYHVFDHTGTSRYTWTFSSSSHRLAGCLLYYRNAAFDTIGAFTDASNPLILPSVSPIRGTAILLAVGARAASSTTLGTPTDMTARVTDNGSSTPSYIVCDQEVDQGETGTRSMSSGSTSGVAGIMLALKPAAPPEIW